MSLEFKDFYEITTYLKGLDMFYFWRLDSG